jgi:toxin YhaV
MHTKGWALYLHPLLESQLEELLQKVKQIENAEERMSHPATKLLATINRYMQEIIPRDPNAPEFRQGNTLGPENRHWFRAKFHSRFRLFYRFSSKHQVIVYAWVNDEHSLRKSGGKSDPYSVFRSMLENGTPPQHLETLLSASRKI